MAKLEFYPQRAFADHFNTTTEDIIKNRSVFKPGIEYHIDYGGRGSAKTWTWADAVVVEASIRPVRILVTRELQNSIEESIKDEIETAITNRGLDWFFDCQKTVIKGRNGSRFIFKGIKNNIKSIKSISNVHIVLCEEAENILEDSWEKMLPSIRPKDGSTPIFIIIFNPDNELDATYQRFIVNTPPNSVKKLINWSDNKYFPEHLNRQRLHAKKTLPPKDYAHIWEGVPKGSGDDVIIDLAWVKAARFASRKEGFKKVGVKITSYDPAGQGRDFNAALAKDGNIILDKYDEWLKSDDLREATKRSLRLAEDTEANIYRYDECGGFGDGVAVFVQDAIDGDEFEFEPDFEVIPFNAGDKVIRPDEIIEGTQKTNEEMYTNAKAQAHGVSAQLLYNTFRFVELGENVAPEDMLSIDIEDDDVFNKLARELSTPIWVKSATNSKKKVEAKDQMEKRTGLKSPNLGDAFHMLNAPYEIKPKGFFDAFIDKKVVQQKERRKVEERKLGEKNKSGFF